MEWIWIRQPISKNFLLKLATDFKNSWWVVHYEFCNENHCIFSWIHLIWNRYDWETNVRHFSAEKNVKKSVRTNYRIPNGIFSGFEMDDLPDSLGINFRISSGRINGFFRDKLPDCEWNISGLCIIQLKQHYEHEKCFLQLSAYTGDIDHLNRRFAYH